MKNRGVKVPGEVDTATTISYSSNMSTLTASAEETPKKDGGAAEKVPNTRVILDVAHAKGTMEDYMVPCPLCHSKLTVSFPSLCLATSIRIQCSNDVCTFVDVQKSPSRANVELSENESPNKERNIDFAVNVVYILGFLTSGDGGKEAAKVLGLLGLPNAPTMEKRSWPNIERSISDTIERVTEEIITENLHMAVENYYGDQRNGNGDLMYDRWKAHDLLEDHDKPSLKVGADMGWQGRSSGLQFNSASGHACLVEQETRLVIAINIKSKICNVCSWYERNDTPVRDHKCVKNHVGLSSGAMEPLAIRDMVVDIYDRKHTIIGTIVTDDDSSIKAKLKWSNEDHMLNNNTTERPTHVTKGGNIVTRPDKGGLPRHIPEPSFLADPNHRKKTLKGALYGCLKRKKADRHGLTKVDVIRITNNFAYMMRSLQELPNSDLFVEKGKAVLGHHFDLHEHCSLSFCKRKAMSQAERDADTDKIYRCKEKDSELYSYLEAVLERYLTKAALLEVGHGMDTQVNESLNNSIAWLAPKNKTYAGSRSLTNRVYIAIGIQSIGSLHYFKRLLGALGIDVTPDVLHYLTQHAEARDYRISKGQEKETKRLRNHKLHAKLKQATIELKGAIAKRDGAIYQPGIGLGGGYNSDDEGSSAPVSPERPLKKKRKVTATRKCGACGLAGHNRSNRMCQQWSPKGAVNYPASSTTRDVEEQQLLDQLTFAPDQEADDEDNSSDEAGALSAIL